MWLRTAPSSGGPSRAAKDRKWCTSPPAASGDSQPRVDSRHRVRENLRHAAASLSFGDCFALFSLWKLSFEGSARVPGEPDSQKKSALKNPFLYSWAVLAIAALVVC